MNKTTVGFSVAGLLIASLGSGLLIRHNQNAELTRRLSKLESALFTESQTALEQSALLQGANAELESMRREAQQRQAAPVPAAPEPEALVRSSALALEKAKSEIVPPKVTADRGQKTYVFPQLVNAKSDVVLTNAEFRTLAGRRLTFRAAAGLRAFDVDELHPGVLAYLDIDPEAVKQRYDSQKHRERIQQIANATAKAQALREWEEHAAKIRVEQDNAAVDRAERLKIAEESLNERRNARTTEARANLLRTGARANERIAVANENMDYTGYSFPYIRQAATTTLFDTSTLGQRSVSGTTTRIGDFDFHRSTDSVGNSLSGTTTHIGDFDFHHFSASDGTSVSGTSTRLGEFRFHNLSGSDGSSVSGTSTKIGDSDFHRFSTTTGKTISGTSTRIGGMVFQNLTDSDGNSIRGTITDFSSPK